MATILKVIQLIEQNNAGQLVINHDALRLIEQVNESIGVVVTVGKKRLGKSFLLNRLLDIDCRKGFQISHVDEPCTKGIYLSSQMNDHINKNGDKMKLMFLDTEGIESHEASKEWDSKIFILGLLLSSYFIYNTNGTYTRDDLEKMSFVTQISSKIQKSSNAQMSSDDYPELLWICRDYKFEIKDDTDAMNALNEFVKAKDNESDIIKNTKTALKKSFNKINGFYLPMPDLQHQNGIPSRKLLLSIEQYKWNDLIGEFVDAMNKLCKKIKDDVCIKKINRCKLNGFMFADYIRKVVDCLNKDQTIYVVDMLDIIIKMNASHELERIKKKYSDELALQFKVFPINWASMYSCETEIRNRYIKELRESIEDPYFEEFKTQFEKYIHDKATISGVFFYYIKKNSDSIKQFADETLQYIKNRYKEEMQVQFKDYNLPIDWNNFENTENQIGSKLFLEYKNKLNGFSLNINNEAIVDLSLAEKQFKEFRDLRDENNNRVSGESLFYYRKNSECLIKKFEQYLSQQWDSARQRVNSSGSLTLQQYEEIVINIKNSYASFTSSYNVVEKDKCWKTFYDLHYEITKSLVKNFLEMAERNRLEQERLRKEREEIERQKREQEERQRNMYQLPSFNYPFIDNISSLYSSGANEINQLRNQLSQLQLTLNNQRLESTTSTASSRQNNSSGYYSTNNREYNPPSPPSNQYNSRYDSDSEDESADCPICGRTFKNEHGVSVHMGRMH